MSKAGIAGVSIGVAIVIGLFSWIFTAPYLGNQGLSRTPGVILGGTLADAPSDLTALNDFPGLILMKQSGFPPLVNYLAWVATPEGVITATRPDGGYWAKRVRERGGDGWLRFGDEVYAMEATEIMGETRMTMLEQWGAKSGRPMDEPVGGAEPLRDWEVFFWTPR